MYSVAKIDYLMLHYFNVNMLFVFSQRGLVYWSLFIRPRTAWMSDQLLTILRLQNAAEMYANELA